MSVCLVFESVGFTAEFQFGNVLQVKHLAIARSANDDIFKFFRSHQASLVAHHVLEALVSLLSKLTFVVGVLTQPVVLEQSSAASPAFLWVESIATKAVLIPIVEELLFRGILFGSFASSFSYKLAIPLSAAIFALVHYTVSWPMVFLIGTMLAWIYWRTGSLAAPMVIHCTVNFFALLSLPLYALLAVNRTLGILAALGLFLAGIPVTCLSTKRFLQKHDALPA